MLFDFLDIHIQQSGAMPLGKEVLAQKLHYDMNVPLGFLVPNSVPTSGRRTPPRARRHPPRRPCKRFAVAGREHMPRSESFSLRLPQPLYDRLFDVIAATGNEVTRSGVIVKALETYLAILECNPGMLEGYDSGRDRSATQKDET